MIVKKFGETAFFPRVGKNIIRPHQQQVSLGSYDDDAADDDDEEEGHDEIDGFLKYFLSLLLVLRHPTPPSSHSATHCLHSVLLQWVTDMKIILLYPESSSSLNVSSVCSDLVST
jgi:hypothetical protein